MAINDLYKVVTRMYTYTTLCENAFWYRQREESSTETNEIAGLMAAVEFAWFGSLDAFLTEDVTFFDIEVWNYTTGVDYDTTVVAGGGTILEQALPAMFAIGLKMNRPNVGWNYPRKRISGFAIGAYSGNGVEAGTAANLATMANAMRTLNADGDVFQWVIIRPGAGFGLGNANVIGEGNVGLFLDAYDATQRSRQT